MTEHGTTTGPARTALITGASSGIGAALARETGVKTPIYRFMFSQQFAFCFPPKPYALAALATPAAR